MPKHRLSSAPAPAAKRTHRLEPQRTISLPAANFDSILVDELVLFIFSYLSWVDLCVIQPTNRHWARLTADNELWKEQFVREYGRLRLRGSRGYHRKHDDREVRPLPGRAKEDNTVDWKWMFRISCNWRRGRCAFERLESSDTSSRSVPLATSPPSCVVLSGSLIITTLPSWTPTPAVYLHRQKATPVALRSTHRSSSPTYISALGVDQSQPTLQYRESRIAAFYETGEFAVFIINQDKPSSSSRLFTHRPTAKSERTSPIIQAAYHHPLLVTLSKAFQISLYDLSDNSVRHTQTLSSFTSFPPSSLVLSAMPSQKAYRLVITYAVPVYPAHWSVAATELTISGLRFSSTSAAESPTASCVVTVTRTARALDVPPGWMTDDKFAEMQAQWGRKVGCVADTQTDGKWVVLASASASDASPSALQLYRLHFPRPLAGKISSASISVMAVTALDGISSSATPRLTFVRVLHGPSSNVRALSLADGRCVALGSRGEVWVWDLERGWGVEVQASLGPDLPSDSEPEPLGDLDTERETGEYANEDPSLVMGTRRGAVVFDERRIVATDARGITTRRFDM